jgi:hypothetical protein
VHDGCVVWMSVQVVACLVGRASFELLYCTRELEVNVIGFTLTSVACGRQLHVSHQLRHRTVP